MGIKWIIIDVNKPIIYSNHACGRSQWYCLFSFMKTLFIFAHASGLLWFQRNMGEKRGKGEWMFIFYLGWFSCVLFIFVFWENTPTLFLLPKHVLCEESIAINKLFDFEILIYWYILRSPEFIYAIFMVVYVYVSKHDCI